MSTADQVPWHDELTHRLIRYPGAFAMRLRILRLRFLGVRIGSRCWIQKICVPRNPWDIVIGGNSALDQGVVLLASGSRRSSQRLRLGSGTYVNRFTMFDASERIEVGRDCMIGPFCYITDHDHGVESDRPIGQQSLRNAAVLIGNNVWIGAHAIILKGVTIGDNAVVGAGAVVTKDVSVGVTVVGIPARVIDQ